MTELKVDIFLNIAISNTNASNSNDRLFQVKVHIVWMKRIIQQIRIHTILIGRYWVLKCALFVLNDSFRDVGIYNSLRCKTIPTANQIKGNDLDILFNI